MLEWYVSFSLPDMLPNEEPGASRGDVTLDFRLSDPHELHVLLLDSKGEPVREVRMEQEEESKMACLVIPAGHYLRVLPGQGGWLTDWSVQIDLQYTLVDDPQVVLFCFRDLVPPHPTPSLTLCPTYPGPNSNSYSGFDLDAFLHPNNSILMHC